MLQAKRAAMQLCCTGGPDGTSDQEVVQVTALLEKCGISQGGDDRSWEPELANLHAVHQRELAQRAAAAAMASGESDGDLSEGRSSQVFEVVLDKKPTGRLGLRLDRFGTRRLQVLDVEDGAANEYNAYASERRQIRPTDFLVEANGCNVPDDMLETMSRSQVVRIVVAKPKRFTVTVSRDGAKQLGLDLSYIPGQSKCAEVQQISRGAFRRYNEKAAHTGEEQVRIFDYLVAVNGISGSAEDLVGALRDAIGEDLEIQLLRCPDTRTLDSAERRRS